MLSKLLNKNRINRSNKPKVALGMSGGVDSSVAAYLLLKQGYEVIGVFLQCWDAKADGCKSDEDRAYAAQTAAQLGIKFEHLDFRAEYKSKVMSYFYSEYLLGRTPNPDVMCNKEIKFGLFYDWAMKNGFDYVATGHYAQVKKTRKGDFQLMQGKDVTKDQSYFLYVLSQDVLAHTLFPIGAMYKNDVRVLAKKLKLPSATRPDSMGICFIGEVDVKDFLKKHIEAKEGNVIDTTGKIVGTHEGVWFYTVGQRHGFKLEKYFGTPMYVIEKRPTENVLVVGVEKDAYVKEFSVEHVEWTTGITQPTSCFVRIRHLGKLHRAKLKVDKGNIMVSLGEPIFGVAPGQSAVFYQRGVVLGGGVIKATL